MSISANVIGQVVTDWQGAGMGEKNRVLDKWATLLSISAATLRRKMPVTKRKRVKTPQKAEYRPWVEIVAQIKKKPPESGGELSTDQAVEIAVNNGLIPREALDVSVGTYDRIMREVGLSKKGKRHVRFQAERPNDAHHFDASSSKFLYIHKRTGGDYILRLHHPSRYYKNKPIPCDKLRPWLYGIVDDHSGLFKAHYVAAKGESMIDSLSFIQKAWSEIGIPKKLLADQGMLKKGLASSEFIARLDVELPQMMPYASAAHGKIERPWRTVWQRFEKQFYAHTDWHKFEITLSELNRRFSIFLADDYNQRMHRSEDITRLQAWKKVQLHGGIVALPEGALATVAKRGKRKVGADGVINYENRKYEVKGLHDAEVYVFEGVFEDRLVVQCIESGEKYEVEGFEPLVEGTYKAHPQTPHQKAVKASEALEIDGGLYGVGKEKDEKVLAMPIRREEKEVEDVFDVSRFASVEDAWSSFTAIAGPVLDPDMRTDIEELMLAEELDKHYITGLAGRLLSNMEESRAEQTGT